MSHGGFREKLPEDVIDAVYEWDAQRRALGGLKGTIALWRSRRRKIGTVKELAHRLGIARTTVHTLLSNRRGI